MIAERPLSWTASNAASVRIAVRSAGDHPSVWSATTACGSGPSVLSLSALTLRIASRSSRLGMGNSTSQSKRPGRLRAGSMSAIRLVAPMTTTLVFRLKPSIAVSSCATTRRENSWLSPSRRPAILSISSRKIIAASLLRASWKRRRSAFSLSPTHLLTIAGPETS